MPYKLDSLFEQGIEYFNTGYFFEAHDTFEELWMDEREESKAFYQGLVQLSTGFYHFVMKNPKGAESQLTRGCEKLSRYKPDYKNIRVDELLNQVAEFIDILKQTGPDAKTYSELVEKIPKLKREFNSK